MGKSSHELALATGALLLLACGGTTGSPPPRPDSGPEPDAGPTNLCEVLEQSYADLGAKTGVAEVRLSDDEDPKSPNVYVLRIPLNEDDPADLFFLELWDQEGPFADGIAPGEVSLIGDQSDIIRCSACAFMSPDHTDDNDIDFHVAYAGTLTLSEVALEGKGSKIAGSLADLKLRAIEIVDGDQRAIDDGCETSLEAMSFSFDVPALPL